MIYGSITAPLRLHETSLNGVHIFNAIIFDVTANVIILICVVNVLVIYKNYIRTLFPYGDIIYDINSVISSRLCHGIALCCSFYCRKCVVLPFVLAHVPISLSFEDILYICETIRRHGLCITENIIIQYLGHV